jgi:hypothetical protein
MNWPKETREESSGLLGIALKDDNAMTLIKCYKLRYGRWVRRALISDLEKECRKTQIIRRLRAHNKH